MPHSIYESITNNQSFPVNIFVAPIQSSTYHWHNEYEMIGILKGSIWMQVQSEQVRLKKGDIYLVNPNVIHAIKGVENEENLCMFVQMSRELLAFDEEDNKVQTRKSRKKDSHIFIKRWLNWYMNLCARTDIRYFG